MNPGFASRINFHIYFEDYNVDELIKIFKNLCKNEKYKIDTGVADILVPFFKREMQKDNFSNARLVRNIFEKAKFVQATRVVNDTKSNKDYLIADDVVSAIQSIDVKADGKDKIGFKIGGVTDESTRITKARGYQEVRGTRTVL